MTKEEKILNDFISSIYNDTIGDMYIVEADADGGNGIGIVVESDHNVLQRSEDVYNIFKDYCSQYFSSTEWVEFIEGESVDFSSRYHNVVEEMDIDYHENYLENNLFVIKQDISKRFQAFIDKKIEEYEYETEDEDDEEGSLPIYMDAWEYGVSVKVKTSSVFPAEWLLNRFNEDRKLKFSQDAQMYITEYAEKINRSRNADRNIYINDVKADIGFMVVSANMYSDNKVSKDIDYFIRNLYDSKDFEKLVKGGLFAPKIQKIVDKWNALVFVKVLDSTTWFDFKVDMQKGLTDYAETLYKNKTINADIRREMYETDVRVNLDFADIIKEDELYYRVSEEKRKAKKSKK